MIEVGFIIFLFHSNLLMGEFERSGMGQRRGLAFAGLRARVFSYNKLTMDRAMGPF